jgi:hypothetical protein
MDNFDGKEEKLGEARFLRGHFYFMLKILFKYVPYIDENVPVDSYETVSNRALSNDALWQKIVADFQYAVDHLPAVQTEVGRANRIAAAAYLAKVYLYKGYRQDNAERNMVTGIDAGDLEKVVQNTDIVLSSNHTLETDFAFNFLPGKYENGTEALFQFSFQKMTGQNLGVLTFLMYYLYLWGWAVVISINRVKALSMRFAQRVKVYHWIIITR